LQRDNVAVVEKRDALGRKGGDLARRRCGGVRGTGDGRPGRKAGSRIVRREVTELSSAWNPRQNRVLEARRGLGHAHGRTLGSW